jgi:hypothetical protein
MALELERYQDAIPHYYLTLSELTTFFNMPAIRYMASPIYWGCQHRLKIIINNNDCISYRRFSHEFDVYGLDIRGQQQIVRKLGLLSNLRHLRLRDLYLKDISYGALSELVLVNCSGVSMDVIAKIGTLRTLIIRNIKVNLKRLPCRLRTLIVTNAGLKSLKGIETVVTLEKVIVANNPLKRVDRLNRLIQLKYLDLSWTEVSDISSLMGLKKLRYLNISDSRVVNYNWVGRSRLKILYVKYPYRMRIR